MQEAPSSIMREFRSKFWRRLEGGREDKMHAAVRGGLKRMLRLTTIIPTEKL
jgi:hypothetical protein